MPTKAVLGSYAPTAAAAQSPALKPTKIPIPPKLGVCVSCQRSADGTAINRLVAGERSSAQMTADAAGRATIATAVLTVSEGNGTPLARCEDATASLGRTASPKPFRTRGERAARASELGPGGGRGGGS